MTAKTTTAEYKDVINLQRVKQLFCKSDEEVSKYFNKTDYDAAERASYLKTVRKILGNMLLNNESEISRSYYTSSCNRMYTKDGIQNLEANIRNFILADGSRDYDIKNCNPTVLLHLYKKHKLPSSNLANYCENRDMLLKKSKFTKSKICALMNMDTPYKTDNNVIDDLIDEIQNNKEKLIQLENKVINKGKKDNKKNPQSSTQGNIIWYYENLILQAVMKKFRHRVSVPMFDGFLATGECDINIMNKVSSPYGLVWCEKPLHTGFQDIYVDEELCDKLLNEFRYSEMVVYWKDAECSYKLAEKVAPFMKSEIVFDENIDSWYVLSGNLFRLVKDPMGYVMKPLMKAIDNGRNILNYKLNQLERNEDNKEVIVRLEKELKSQLSTPSDIDKPGFRATLKSNLKSLLVDNSFIDKLDKNPNQMMFKNGVYNIIDKTFRYGLSSRDMITKHLEFNYDPERNKEDEDFILEQLWKMFMNEKHKEYYLSVLGYALSGTPHIQQKMYFLIGQVAGNGKSAILTALTKIMPNYVYKASSQLFEAGYEKKHKIALKLFSHRIVWCEEMKKGKKIDGGYMKEIADGEATEVEIMYGTTRSADIQAKCFMVGNMTPVFDDCDAGVARKFDYMQFNSSWRPWFTCDNYETRQFKIDDDIQAKYKEKRMSFLHILLDFANRVYHQGMPETPQEFKDEIESVLQENDEFGEWFDDKTIISEGNSISKKAIIVAADKSGICVDSRDVINKLKARGLVYDKNATKKGERGVFKGIDWKPKEEEDPTPPEEIIISDDEEQPVESLPVSNIIISDSESESNSDSDSD